MPSDDERDDPDEREFTGHDFLASSVFQGAAEELVGTGARLMGVDDDDKRQDLRNQVDEMMPAETSAEQRSDLLDAAVAGGLALGASRTEIREALGERAAAREDDDADVDVGGPLVQAREIEHADGSFGGVRVFVDLPPEQVDVFRGDRSLLIRTAAGEHEEPLGFAPGEIDHVNDDADGEAGVAEFIVRASDPGEDLLTAEESVEESPSGDELEDALDGDDEDDDDDQQPADEDADPPADG